MQPFASYNDKFSPYVFQGHALIRRSMRYEFLSDPRLATSSLTTGIGIEITGYGSLADAQAAIRGRRHRNSIERRVRVGTRTRDPVPTHQAGVKTVAMGGLPNTGPMQAIGGAQGLPDSRSE